MVALVNPSMFVSATVSALMPLVSSKAYKKVVKCSGGIDQLGYKAGGVSRVCTRPTLCSDEASNASA